MAMTMERRGSTTELRSKALPESVPGFLGATCSVLSEARGRTAAGGAAGGRDVRVGGGVCTIRQYLRAALIDELHLAIRPVLLGSGEHLLSDFDMRALGYECTNYIAGERAMHVFLGKRA